MNKFGIAATAALLLAALAPSAASAQIAKSGKAYLLRLKFRAGEDRKYTLSTELSGIAAAPGGGIKLSGPLEEKIISVKGKTANVTVSIGALKTKDGQAFGEPQSTTITVDELGNASGSVTGQSSFGVHFPKNPVKIGETWTHETQIGGATGGSSVVATYKFNGIKKVGKQQLADISFTIGTSGMVKGGSGRTYLQPSNGALVSTSMKILVANPQGGDDITTTVNITPTK
jgi:hypothetical protein